MKLSIRELARQFVGFNTISVGNQGNTADMADFISEYCTKEADCEVVQFPYGNSDVRKANVVAYKGGRDTHLALSGHMDTVSCAPKHWSTDPFTLTFRDNRYFGLGIADMKFFAVAAIKAVEAIPTADLKRPVAIYFTSDEEIGCVGARKLVSEPKFRLAPYIVVGEPTQMQPVVAHKGYMYFQVEVTRNLRDKEREATQGKRTVHSSDDRTTTNVVELAMPTVISALSSFRQMMQQHHRDDRFDPRYPTMNIGGKIRMAENATKNVIPGSIVLENDLRLLPGQEPEVLLHVLRLSLSRAVAQIHSTVRGEEIQVKVSMVRPASPPMSTSIDSEIVQAIMPLCLPHQPQSVPYNTEGGCYNRAGAQCVIWGPGSIAQAHRENEFVDAHWLSQEIVDQYERLIRRMCC